MAIASIVRSAVQRAIREVQTQVTLRRRDASDPDQTGVPAVLGSWSDLLVSQGVVADTDMKVIVADADIDWIPRQLDYVVLPDGRTAIVESVKQVPVESTKAVHIMRVST